MIGNQVLAFVSWMFGTMLLVGCATTSQPPAWVTTPIDEGGIAATECVPAGGNFSLERQSAAAKARSAIARQIELRVAAMSKVYERISSEEQGQKVETAFESVSKQVAEQTLSGLKIERGEYVTIRDQDQFCALVRLTQPDNTILFDNIVEGAAPTSGGQARKSMFAEFNRSQSSGGN